MSTTMYSGAAPAGLDPATGAAGETEAGTRQRVLALVASGGPVTATELAAELHLAGAGIRRHLGALKANGQIGLHDGVGIAPVRRGRPARHYVVTAHGQAALSNACSELAAQALRHLAEVAGPGAVEVFAASRMRRLAQQYAVAVVGAPDVAARVDALAHVLDRDGYAASTRPVPGMAAVQLCQGHCPVQLIAAEFPQLCEAETQAFSQMLGVHVQRLATLARGGHVCTTNIPTSGRPEERRTT